MYVNYRVRVLKVKLKRTNCESKLNERKHYRPDEKRRLLLIGFEFELEVHFVSTVATQPVSDRQ